MQSILLLHGALGSDRQMEPLKAFLSERFDVHVLCFEGHGNRKSNRKLAIPYFSENVQDYLTEKNLKQPMVFGYSMGGYVALYTEAICPATFKKIVTFGTKFEWNPDVAAREVRMLHPEVIEDKVPKFAAYLDGLHRPSDWKIVMKNTAEMMEEMGAHPPLSDVDLQRVKCPVHLLLGTKDTMVSKEETVAIQEQLLRAQFDFLEDAEHAIVRLNLSSLQPYF
jgi:pimeloyl-ACP methyl ester carboxylesterase